MTRSIRVKPRHAFLAASLAVALGVFAFACGSNEDAPPTCEGAACIDGGGSESSTPEGSTSDGPIADSPTDSPNESGDAGACKLQEAGPDGGALQWASNFGTTGHTTPTAVALDPLTDDVVVVGSRRRRRGRHERRQQAPRIRRGIYRVDADIEFFVGGGFDVPAGEIEKSTEADATSATHPHHPYSLIGSTP